MNHTEETLQGRRAGLKIMTGSAACGCVGLLPLLLYMVFGPANGNPIGLGLLAAAAIALAGIGVVVGGIVLIVQHCR